jgi:hypothetical protein
VREGGKESGTRESRSIDEGETFKGKSSL